MFKTYHTRDSSRAYLRLRDERVQHDLFQWGVLLRRLRRQQQSGALRGGAPLDISLTLCGQDAIPSSCHRGDSARSSGLHRVSRSVMVHISTVISTHV